MTKYRTYEKIIDMNQFIPIGREELVIEVSLIESICKDYHKRKLEESPAQPVLKSLKDKKTIGFPAWRKLNKIKKVKGMYTYKGIEQNDYYLWLVYILETKQDL